MITLLQYNVYVTLYAFTSLLLLHMKWCENIINDDIEDVHSSWMGRREHLGVTNGTNRIVCMQMNILLLLCLLYIHIPVAFYVSIT